MPQQRRTDALLLIVVDHNESDLSRARLLDDIAAPRNDCGVVAFFNDRHQGDMLRKVDIHEKCDLFVGKASLCAEETTVERLRAGTLDRGTKIGPVLWSERANLEPTPIARGFGCRVSGCFQHQALVPSLV